MEIEVDKVQAAGTPFAQSYAPDELALDDTGRLIAPAEVSGRAFRRGNKICLQGNIKTDVEACCDRCANPVAVHIDVDFDVTFIPVADEVAVENVELQEEDLSLSVFEDNAVHLDELVREQVLLAMPARLLCSEECKGLCSTCGADLNADTCACGRREVDPRWTALRDLQF